MEFNLQQVIAAALNETQQARYNELKNKDDNFEVLTAEEIVELNGFKKAIADAKKNQHIIPLKEDFKKVFPQVADHFTSDEAKNIVKRVVAKLDVKAILEAIIKKDIVAVEDGVEVVKGQTSGFTVKELTKALKDGGTTDSGEGIKVRDFKLSEFKFTGKDKEAIDKAIKDGKVTDTFTWMFGKQYGGLAWQNVVIQAITHKGNGGVKALDAALKGATPEFTAWLEVSRQGEGPAKDRQIFENKREFFKKFGLTENRETFAEAKKKKDAAKAAAAKKAA